MTRTELLKEIEHALKYRQCRSEEAKEIDQAFKDLKQALERLEKLEKALKILKDKKVSIGLLLKNNTLNQYNRVRHLYDASDYLTAEEYELLKEVLENENIR